MRCNIRLELSYVDRHNSQKRQYLASWMSNTEETRQSPIQSREEMSLALVVYKPLVWRKVCSSAYVLSEEFLSHSQIVSEKVLNLLFQFECAENSVPAQGLLWQTLFNLIKNYTKRTDELLVTSISSTCKRRTNISLLVHKERRISCTRGKTIGVKERAEPVKPWATSSKLNCGKGSTVNTLLKFFSICHKFWDWTPMKNIWQTFCGKNMKKIVFFKKILSLTRRDKCMINT